MWSYSYTGERSRLFKEGQRVGMLIDMQGGMTDGTMFEILHRSVARGVRNFICHQRASPVCKSVFSKMFKRTGAVPSKDNNISTATMRREDFTICLVLPREVFKANRGDTMSAIKQAAEGLGAEYVDAVLLPWPTDSTEFVGPQSTQETQAFRLGWRKASEVVSRQPGLVKDLGVVDMEVWQLEATLPSPTDPSPARKPALHLISGLSPDRARVRQVCFSQQHGVEVVAAVDTPDMAGKKGVVLQRLMAAYSKSAVEVLATWCYQRGIVALPRLACLTVGPASTPDEHNKRKDLIDRELQEVERLNYPLTRRPLFCAPTQGLSFFLAIEEVEALSLEGAEEEGAGHAPSDGEDAKPPQLAGQGGATGSGSEEVDAASVLRVHKAVVRQVEKDMELLALDGPPDPRKEAVLKEELPLWEESTLDKKALEASPHKQEEQDEQVDEGDSPRHRATSEVKSEEAQGSSSPIKAE